MPQISAVIITYNEERNIERCLKSLKGVADDIVVVDSFSTDCTKAICEKNGVRFVQHKFEGFIEQKNWAITQAKFPHILSLDADEALSEKLKSAILEVKENWLYDAYFFNRLTNYCGKWIRHTGWYPDRKLRLCDSRKGAWGGENPHDKYILQVGATQKFIEGDLLHYSYYTITEHISQVNKFTDISSREIFLKRKKASLLKIIFKPVWKFLRDFIFKLGFLDGYYGFVISAVSAFATFTKYLKLRELHKTHKR